MIQTARGYEDPVITQFSIFLQNRVGELADLLRHLEQASVVVHALSINDSVDFAVLRLVPAPLEVARATLIKAGYTVSEGNLVGVELADNKGGMLSVCRALIQAEINIHYAYPMLFRPRDQAVVLIHVEHPPTATEVLRKRGFALIDHRDLEESGEQEEIR
ncbi:MAG: acetolactate synthase [Planctomycetes bacterium]|nr:acetolactate synthase [Planctomycetota bacterium]